MIDEKSGPWLVSDLRVGDVAVYVDQNMGPSHIKVTAKGPKWIHFGKSFKCDTFGGREFGRVITLRQHRAWRLCAEALKQAPYNVPLVWSVAEVFEQVEPEVEAVGAAMATLAAKLCELDVAVRAAKDTKP